MISLSIFPSAVTTRSANFVYGLEMDERHVGGPGSVRVVRLSRSSSPQQ